MPPSTPLETVSKITDLEHINRLRAMLDDDGTHYDWAQADQDALGYALTCISRLRSILVKNKVLGRE